MNYAVIDTETTGLYNKDRIVEIGVVLLDEGGTVIDEWDTLIDPSRDVGPTHIHRISASMVSMAPTFEEIIGPLAERLNGAVLVGHNLSFDVRFLANELERTNHLWEPGNGIDTLALTRCKLGHACEQFGVPHGTAHRALADARATAGLLSKLLGQISGLGTTQAYVAPAASGRSRTLRRDAFQQPPTDPRVAASIQPLAQDLDFRNYRVTDLGYLDLLDRAFDDLWLTEQEQHELAALAGAAGLDQHQLSLLHRQYIVDLGKAALRDGHLSIEELHHLEAVAFGLGLDLRAIFPDLPEAVGEVEGNLDLATGMVVVFTGAAIDPQTGASLTRSQLSELAHARGYEVGKGLTKKTDLLVASDPASQSGKAKKARTQGTPVVSVSRFLELCRD